MEEIPADSRMCSLIHGKRAIGVRAIEVRLYHTFLPNNVIHMLSGGAKVSCILRHWDVQLILAYSWARPAILVAGKGRGGNVFFFFFFFFFFLFFVVFFSSISSLSFLFLFSFIPFSGRRYKMTHKGWGVVKPQHNQSPWFICCDKMANSTDPHQTDTFEQFTLCLYSLRRPLYSYS